MKLSIRIYRFYHKIELELRKLKKKKLATNVNNGSINLRKAMNQKNPENENPRKKNKSHYR